MAQKFGNGRWVHEGFLDNRVEGLVVGRIVFAAIGPRSPSALMRTGCSYV